MIKPNVISVISARAFEMKRAILVVERRAQ